MWEASHWVDGGDIIELFRCTQGMHSENSIVAAQALRPNSREQLRCASLLDVCPTMKNRWVADQSQFANFKLGYLWISWIFFYNSESPVSSQKFCKSTRTLWLFPVQWFFFCHCERCELEVLFNARLQGPVQEVLNWEVQPWNGMTRSRNMAPEE